MRPTSRLLCLLLCLAIFFISLQLPFLHRQSLLRDLRQQRFPAQQPPDALVTPPDLVHIESTARRIASAHFGELMIAFVGGGRRAGHVRRVRQALENKDRPPRPQAGQHALQRPGQGDLRYRLRPGVRLPCRR